MSIFKLIITLSLQQISLVGNNKKVMLELKCQEKFSMGSTYDYNKEIENTIIESITGEIKAKCSIRKIVRTICNLLKINPLECCLLAWLLSKSKYDIDKISTQSRSKIVEEEFDHKVLIYILMNAYYVKEFVCEKLDPEVQSEVSNQITNFKHLYSKKFNPEKSLKTLSLSDINRIFNEWTCRQNKRNKMDYNSLVDKILYLSKSYNVTAHDQTKQQKLGVPRKRRKMNNESNVDQNEGKSNIESVNQEKSQSIHNYGNQKNKKSYVPFKFTSSPDAADFLGPSQQHQPSYTKRQQMMDMQHSKRTTRNMLQSINIYDYIPSQDNLFNSQLSSFSINNLMGSQQSARNSMIEVNSTMRRSNRGRAEKNQLKLRQTDSFDEIK